ncbi:MAG: hypothetical protein DRI84_03730 [Bacteroidetes bacterium]|nr:MAG: hypothetical protein DRI84_03730 [Bacteroidota bacterium]
MLKHIVFIKLKSGYSLKDRTNILNKLKQMLDNLQSEIVDINKMETGLNFSTRDSAFDLSLSVELDNEEALNRYRIDTEHKKVLDYMKGLDLETAVVDYTI